MLCVCVREREREWESNGELGGEGLSLWLNPMCVTYACGKLNSRSTSSKHKVSDTPRFPLSCFMVIPCYVCVRVPHTYAKRKSDKHFFHINFACIRGEEGRNRLNIGAASRKQTMVNKKNELLAWLKLLSSCYMCVLIGEEEALWEDSHTCIGREMLDREGLSMYVDELCWRG